MSKLQIDIPEDLLSTIIKLAEHTGVSIEEFARISLQNAVDDHSERPHQFTPYQLQQIEAGLSDSLSGHLTLQADVVREIEQYLEK